MSVIRKLNYIFSTKQKWQSLWIVVLIIIGSALELLGVSTIMPFINSIMDPEQLMRTEPYHWLYENCGFTSSLQFILVLIGALILIYVIKNLYLLWMYREQYRYIYSNMRSLSIKMMRCYLDQPYSFHTKHNSAELLRNINQDTADFFGVIQALVKLATEGLTVLVLVGYLFIKDKTIMIAMGGALAFITLVFMHNYKKRLRYMGDKNRYYEAQVNKWVQQAFGGIKEIKVMNREDFFYNHYDHAFAGRVKSEYTYHTYISIPKPVMETGMLGALLLAIALKLLHGTAASYFIPTISIFAVAASRLLPSFNRIMEYLGTITYQGPAVEAIYRDLREIDELLNNTAEKLLNVSDCKMEFERRISINNVTFQYPDSKGAVLKNVTMSIEKNSSVAFVGPSGSGKTTLADLILGVLTPSQGNIECDNSDIRLSIHRWHKTVGYIPQNIYLIDDTIANNIAFGEQKIDYSRLANALEKAQLSSFVESLPEGLDTEVGERGVRLSGGQRQRIGIARALYNEPEILILDEATSALDNETEAAVMDAINSLQGKMTLIIIAHRLSTIKECDVTYRIENGDVRRIKTPK